MSLTPVFSFDLLADRHLKPSAIKLHIGEGEPQALLPLITDERFVAFAAALPCLIGSDLARQLPPEVSQALQAAGCQMLADDEVQRSDGQNKPVLAPMAQWLFGNWYLAAPVKTSGNQTASYALSLKLLQRVAADADTGEIEDFFRQDPVLAYHLLRLVNSLGAGTGRYISSFSQAILILGRQQLKRWLNLMLFAARRDDHRSAMLLASTALRARRMELLAKACGFDRATQELAFLAGMFSLLGILFGMPLPEIMNPLRLNAALSRAVLSHEGELGRLLQAAESAECVDPAVLPRLLDEIGLSVAEFNLLNLDACQWMLGVINEGAVNA